VIVESEKKERVTRMAKELNQQKKEAARTDRKMQGVWGIGSQGMGRNHSPIVNTSPTEPPKATYAVPRLVMLARAVNSTDCTFDQNFSLLLKNSLFIKK
jgi:hypothetical protein